MAHGSSSYAFYDCDVSVVVVCFVGVFPGLVAMVGSADWGAYRVYLASAGFLVVAGAVPATIVLSYEWYAVDVDSSSYWIGC